MNARPTAKPKQILAITGVGALTVVATLVIVLNTRPTHAEVDCSGDWWNSTDSIVVETCAKTDPNYDPWGELATADTQPFLRVDPTYIPEPKLPEPDEIKVIYSIPYDPSLGPLPSSSSGVTTFWRDGAIPTDDYMFWDELYVLTRPGNGASYVEIGSGEVITVTTNPTLETLVSVGGNSDSKYQKSWVDPQADGALYITNITNPDYTNTDPNIPYPGLQSVVYFTTKSGQTGHFTMSTQTWTFDAVGTGPLPTPTAPPAYP